MGKVIARVPLLLVFVAIPVSFAQVPCLSPSFAPPSVFRIQSPGPIGPGDFNGDGKLDLAVSHRDANTVAILLGNGSGGFATPALFSVNGPTENAVADFNGDRRSDKEHRFSILRGPGRKFGQQPEHD